MKTVLIFTVKENDNNYFTFSEEAFQAFCKENNLTETGYSESNKGIPDETVKVGEDVWAYNWNEKDVK